MRQNWWQMGWLWHLKGKCVVDMHCKNRVTASVDLGTQSLWCICVFSTGSPAQRHLETCGRLPRVSHRRTPTGWRAFPSFHADALSRLISAAFSTGEGTRSPQSGYVQLSPTTAPHRSSDLSTFPPIFSTPTSPQQPSSVLMPRTCSSALPFTDTAASPGLELRKKHWEKNTRNAIFNLVWDPPYCCKLWHGSILGVFYFQITCLHV